MIRFKILILLTFSTCLEQLEAVGTHTFRVNIVVWKAEWQFLAVEWNVEITLACCSEIAKGWLSVGYVSHKICWSCSLRAFTSLYPLLSQIIFCYSLVGLAEAVERQKWFCFPQIITKESQHMKTRIKSNSSDSSSLNNTTWCIFCWESCIWQTVRNYVGQIHLSLHRYGFVTIKGAAPCQILAYQVEHLDPLQVKSSYLLKWFQQIWSQKKASVEWQCWGQHMALLILFFHLLNLDSKTICILWLDL